MTASMSATMPLVAQQLKPEKRTATEDSEFTEKIQHFMKGVT
jgi:hypothetical protein